MGKIKTGILGGFQGKVGTVIGSTWRGESIMRALPKTAAKAPTESQRIQRLKFNPNSAIEKKEYFSILISNCVAVEKNKR